MKSIVLLSGGVDSALCLAEEITAGHEPIALTFHYGQRHAREILSATHIAGHYNIPHQVIVLPVIEGSALTDPRAGMPQGATQSVNQTYVPGRNLIILSFACSFAEANEASRVVMGACKDDAAGYPDCRPEFFDFFRAAVHAGMNADIDIDTPNITRSKEDIFKRCRELDVPLDLTWSCYDPQGEEPCGTCSACVLNNAHR